MQPKAKSIYVIAEAGSNHDGKLAQAKRLIEVAAESGADAVKFQLFRAAVLYPDVNHPVHKVVRENELPREWIPELAAHSRKLKIDFLATPFDLEAIAILEKEKIAAYKWASSETTNHPLLQAVARTGKPIYMSTGMCTMADIAEAVEVLAANGAGPTTLLHCYSVYPTPFEEANLRVMATLAKAFQLPVGFSDHSLGIALPIASAALGATVIEKHFTLDRTMPGPDHSYALEPNELKEMVTHIRSVEKAMGTAEKKLHPLETEWGRRDGIYLRRAVPAGQRLRPEDLWIKRPAKSIPARFARSVTDLELTEALPEGAALQWSNLKAPRG